MADTKISSLTQLTSTPDPLDELELVDKSDTSMAAAGTNKRIQFKDLGLAWVLAASGAAVSCPADTTEDTLATITVPANALGVNGSLRIWTGWTFTGSTNIKTFRVRFSGGSGTGFLDLPTSTAANIGASIVTQIHNRNATNSQIGFSGTTSSGIGFLTVAAPTAAVDTTASTTVVITGQKANSGETLTLSRYIVEVLPAD